MDNQNEQKKSALILTSNGSEELETVVITNILRRADIKVLIVSIQNEDIITFARGVRILSDLKLNELGNELYDAVILPGGNKGSKELSDNTKVGEILRNYESNKKIVAAICAGPLAFLFHKIGLGGKITSHPSIKEYIVSTKKYSYSEERVCVWNNIITSRGPGTASEFALMIVEILLGLEIKNKLKFANLFL